jgi:LacI family transcriptional regulator
LFGHIALMKNFLHNSASAGVRSSREDATGIPRQRKVLMLQASYNPAVHEGIARAARELNWHLDISLMRTRRLPRKWEGDGIICSLNQEEAYADFIRRHQLPSVDTSIWRMDLEMPRISTDNSCIGELAAEHFLAKGHQHFAWYAYESTPWGHLRREAYERALARHRVEVVRLEGKDAQNPLAVRKRMQGLPQPTAIFCQNDFDAAWILNRCLEEGWRVPEEFAILGVDNNPLICELQPIQLSSVNKDFATIAYEGCLLLQRMMQGKPVSDQFHTVQPGGIKVRASTDALAVADPLVREVLHYMQSNLRESFGATELAGKFNIPEAELQKRFRKCLYTTVHKKLMEMRLQRAMQLIISTEAPIEEIAAMTGFCNAPHLTRCFKQKNGLPPLRYRKTRSGSRESLKAAV